MFGNFARWNEPSRDSGSSQGPDPGNLGNPGNPGYPVSGLMSSSQSKKADYKVVNASPDFESSSPQRYPSSRVFEFSMEILGCLVLNLKRPLEGKMYQIKIYSLKQENDCSQLFG